MNFLTKGVIIAALVFPPFLFSQSSTVIRPAFSQPTTGGPYDLSPRKLQRPKVGLVLSGGGARGAAHIGVLKVLEKHNIPIDFIAGNSMGAIVGGLYAAGYSVAELESIALNTNWADLLSLTEETRRTDLYLDQKQALEHSFLLIRFDGLQPVLPASISSGQRLTNMLTELTLQALYHPDPNFDALKIPFRAVATDLISGQRVVLDSGPLAEALRASVTVPLLFAPLERGDMSLVDGGLVSNAPVDLARSYGCDVIISSNVTSGMRQPDQLNAPWETADQIMSIMMQLPNQMQFEMADIVLVPDLGNHLSSAFTGLDSLIRLGEEETEQKTAAIQASIAARAKKKSAGRNETSSLFTGPQKHVLRNIDVEITADDLPQELRDAIAERAGAEEITTDAIKEDLAKMFLTGRYADVYAEVSEDASTTMISYYAVNNPVVREIHFTGNTSVSGSTIAACFSDIVGKPIHYADLRKRLESVLSLYRAGGFSLAKIDSLQFDEQSGVLRFIVNEGIIRRVVVEGNDYTEDYVIRREFPQEDGEIFSIRQAQRGIVNISSTGLFEYVLLDIRYEAERPVIVLKVKEKPTNHMRLGVQADNERSLLGLIDLRDVNLFGTGGELGFTFATSFRNRLYRLEYRANRIFNTVLTFNMRGYFRFDDIYTYANSSSTTVRRWERVSIGEYRVIRKGGSFTFGAQLERWGNVTSAVRIEDQEVKVLGGAGVDAAKYRFASLRVGTVIDTENRYPFPTSGMMFATSYEAAMRHIGSDVSFGKVSFVYEFYSTFHPRHTVRPKITIAVADETLPLAEQFSLGGINSFFGLRENDTRGRQLFLINTEYRFWLPFKIVFESYVKLRYDLGMISSVPEEIQWSKLHHGIGAELALATPIGPASFGIGKSFFVRKDLRNEPLSVGPILLYFSIGYGM